MRKFLFILAAYAAVALTAAASDRGLAWSFDGDQWNLMYGRVQVGSMDARGYRPLNNGVWGDICDPPVPPPEALTCRCRQGQPCKCNGNCHCGRCVNYGVDRSHFHTGERITVNGRVITGDDAHRIIGGPVLPEDAAHPYAVYVAEDAADAAAAKAALKPFESAWRVFVCQASDWYAKDRDGKLAFAPGLTAVTLDGRQMRLANVDALRQVPPNFDPTKQPVGPKPAPEPKKPEPKKPDTPVTPAPSTPTPWCCVLAMGVIAAQLLIRKGK